MILDDFLTPEEYEKRKNEPPVDDKKVFENQKYEDYKLNFMYENGYTLDDLVKSLGEFAKCKNLYSKYLQWQEKSGFGKEKDMWLSRQLWESGNTSDFLGSDVEEIVEMLESGYTADDLAGDYPDSQIEFAVQYLSMLQGQSLPK